MQANEFKWQYLIIAATVAVVFFATAFLSIDNLVETQLLSKSYAFVAGAILCVASLLICVKRIELPFDAVAGLVLLVLGSILLRMALVGQFGLKFMIIVSFLLFYLFFRTIGNKFNNLIEFIIVLVCGSQAVYGLMQYMNIVYSPGGFRMMGNFDNPAGLAALLSAGVPFCFVLTERSKRLKNVGWISLILIIVTVIFSGSRAGILAIITVCIIYTFDRYKSFLKRHWWIIVVISVLLCSLCIGLLYIKKDSAIGRTIIWRTSIEMIKDKPLLGHGTNSFQAKYMPYQANYFKTNPNSRYAQLADNVSHPFNEYILLTVEHGIFGLAILLVIAVAIFCNTKKITPTFLCIISISVFSCFSYPTRYACILLLLAYSLGNVKLPRESCLRLNIAGRILGLIIVCILTARLICDVKFESKWGNLVRLNSLGKRVDLLDSYLILYDNWNGNPLFLYNYGVLLNSLEEFASSLSVMNKCEKYYNDYDIQMIIADNYYNLLKREESLVHYQLSSYMCPNRFRPLYFQVLIYDEAEEYEKALSLAIAIINKPIKIQSATTDWIIKEMSEYIDLVPLLEYRYNLR